MLWGVVVAAYLLLIVVANPHVSLSEARRHAIYEDIWQRRCTLYTMTAVEEASFDQGVTIRAGWLIYNYGNEHGWDHITCPPGSVPTR